MKSGLGDVKAGLGNGLDHLNQASVEVPRLPFPGSNHLPVSVVARLLCLGGGAPGIGELDDLAEIHESWFSRGRCGFPPGVPLLGESQDLLIHALARSALLGLCSDRLLRRRSLPRHHATRGQQQDYGENQMLDLSDHWCSYR